MKKTQYYLAASTSLITFIVYLSTLQNEFITWDDESYIVANRNIRSFDMTFFKWAFTDFYSFNWHPFTWISHALDYAVWGLNPSGHHLTNNILHAVNTFLVVFLIIKLLETARERAVQAGLSKFLTERTILIAAGVTGLLFVLHPLHVESVAWVSERKDLLCGLFFLLSIIPYLRYEQSVVGQTAPRNSLIIFSNKFYLLTLAFFILALLSKPMAVTLPVVLLILDWYPLKRVPSLKAFRCMLTEKLPFIALSLASSIVTVFAERKAMYAVDVSLATRLLVAVKSLIYYLWKMIWPLNLVPLYPYPNSYEVSLLSFEYLSVLALVIVITIACIVIAKKQKVWLTAWGYYVVTLIPVIGIVHVGSQSMADRYTYLPSLGPFLIFGLGTAWIYNKVYAGAKTRLTIQFLGVIMAIIILAVVSFLTIKQIGIWRDSFVFWNYVIEKQPSKSTIPYINLGAAYIKKGLLDQAIEQDLIAVKLNPDSPEYQRILGETYAMKGSLDQAIQRYQIAIRLAPKDSLAHHDLGAAYEKKGAFDEAIEQYQIVVQLDPDYSPARNNLGAAYQKKGLTDKAIEQYRIAANLNPNYGLAHNNLGAAYDSKGLFDQAVEQYLMAVKLDPNYALPHNNLGAVYMKKGLLDQAIEQYQIAVRLAPNYIQAHNNLGEAYLKKGLREQAVEHFRIAVNLEPKNPIWRRNLAKAKAQSKLSQ